MPAAKFFSVAAIVAAVIALMAGPAAADATLAVTTDPQPTAPGSSTSIAVALTPTSDTNVSFDPTLTLSSSSADVTLSVTSDSPTLGPCSVAANVVTCTPPGLLVSDGVENLVVNAAVAASAAPSTVTLTATYTQFSTPAVVVTRLFDVTPPPPPPTTSPTTEPTTTASVGASTVSPTSTGTGAGQLPNTGSSSPALVWIGVVLAMSGAGIVLTRPRRRGRAASDN